jgi:hypothetical protein
MNVKGWLMKARALHLYRVSSVNDGCSAYRGMQLEG